MPKHFLNGSQVRSVLYQMRGKRMSESMRRHILVHICQQSKFPDYPEHEITAEGVAISVDKDIVTSGKLRRSFRKIYLQGVCGDFPDRNDPFLVSLAYYPYEALIKMADERLGDYAPSEKIKRKHNI